MATSRSSRAGHAPRGSDRKPPTFKGTNCPARNHEYAHFGRYANGQCKECKRIYNEEQSEARKGSTVYGSKRSSKNHAEKRFNTLRIIDLGRQIENEPIEWRRASMRSEMAELVRDNSDG